MLLHGKSTIYRDDIPIETSIYVGFPIAMCMAESRWRRHQPETIRNKNHIGFWTCRIQKIMNNNRVLKQTSKTNEKGGTQSLPAVSLKIPCGWSSIKDEAKGDWWFPVQFYYPILSRFFWLCSRWLHCNAVLWPWPFFLDPSDWKGPRPIVFWSAGTQPLSCWWTWDLSLSWFIYVYLLFIWTSYEHQMNKHHRNIIWTSYERHMNIIWTLLWLWPNIV